MRDEADVVRAAGEHLDVSAKWIQPFRLSDPFNDDIEVGGAICRRPDHRYGALFIAEVGGEPAEQVVAATPKLAYPFDRVGEFRFPAIRRITIYDKIDGTNVLAYRYRDSGGHLRTTYKLRLYPFLRNGRHGAFLDLWTELLRRHPDIERLAAINGCSVAFELYGRRNVHLIEYEVDLEVAALFGVRANYGVVPLHDLDTRGVPTAARLGELRGSDDPVERYHALRAEHERENRPADDERISGTEGSVWYAEGVDGTVSLWKCKPESVEAIHWATGICKAAVLATCHNVLETSDTLHFAALLPLLLEEYSEEEIQRFRPHIDACIAMVNAELAFSARVLELYRSIGLSLTTHKADVMRKMSSHFEPRQMGKVYALVALHEQRGGSRDG